MIDYNTTEDYTVNVIFVLKISFCKLRRILKNGPLVLS